MAPNHVLSMRTPLAPPPARRFDDGALPVAARALRFEDRTGWSGDGTPTGFNAEFFETNGPFLDRAPGRRKMAIP